MLPVVLFVERDALFNGRAVLDEADKALAGGVVAVEAGGLGGVSAVGGVQRHVELFEQGFVFRLPDVFGQVFGLQNAALDVGLPVGDDGLGGGAGDGDAVGVEGEGLGLQVVSDGVHGFVDGIGGGG